MKEAMVEGLVEAVKGIAGEGYEVKSTVVKKNNGVDQMLGGGPYEAITCPECGSTMWNGRCENPDCKYHWHPVEEEEEDE